MSDMHVSFFFSNYHLSQKGRGGGGRAEFMDPDDTVSSKGFCVENQTGAMKTHDNGEGKQLLPENRQMRHDDTRSSSSLQ